MEGSEKMMPAPDGEQGMNGQIPETGEPGHEKKKKNKPLIEKWIFFACALFSIVAVAGIIIFIFVSAVPAFAQTGFFQFVFGTTWDPADGVYGILPMIVNSLCVTLGALVFGGILGIFSALFLVYWCPSKLKKPFEKVIDVFAGIPSVIFGFFGLVMIEPVLRIFSSDSTGFGLMACWLILMLMILPTIAGMTKNALNSVPESYYEGAIALGMTKEQAIFTVMLPAAKSGIISGLILGMGRAIGEAMAVIMVAGNAPVFPTGLFTNIRTMTTTIAMEMAYASADHRSALIAIGFILLIFILILNFALGLTKRSRLNKGGTRKMNGTGEPPSIVYRKKGIITKILKYVSMVLSAVVVVALVGIILFVVVRAIPNMSWHLLFGKSRYSDSTLAPAFVNTFMVILLALVIALPIGICSAIYLHEYSKPGSKIVKAIRLFTDTLSGIPSIVFGLFGNILFCDLMGLGYSLLAGSLTMSLVVLPTIIRSVEESLIAVPDSLREASLALGASKLQTVWKVVLPQALPGILTAAILSIGRIIGESAALIYTAGTAMLMPANGYFSSGGTFAVLIYVLATEGGENRDNAYVAAFVALILVAIIYVALGLIEYFSKKEKGQKKHKEKIKPPEVTA